jgi:hypothetical protein
MQTIDFSLSHLSSLNRFLRISFALGGGKVEKPSVITIQYRPRLMYVRVDGVIEESSHDSVVTSKVAIKAGQTQTPRLVMDSQVVVDFRLVNISLELLSIPKEFTQVRIMAVYGSVSHTYFQIAFRTLFEVVAAIVALFFVFRLRRIPTHAWFFEQKLTVPLVILVFFYDNPFYALHAYAPSRAYVIFDTIARDVFNAYFRFFILALFDSLRFKNRKITTGFYVPKVAIVLVLFLSSVAHGIYDDMTQFGLARVSADNVERSLRGAEVVLFFWYVIWASGSVAVAGFKVDPTDRYKFALYLATGGTALGVLALVHVLFDEFAALRQSSLRFLAGFSVENGFVILMVFFHWPCAVVQPKELGGAKDVTEQDPELFVDGDEVVE